MINKKIFKKSPEELREWLSFRNRGGKVKSKKGKTSYRRHAKHKQTKFNDE